MESTFLGACPRTIKNPWPGVMGFLSACPLRPPGRRVFCQGRRVLASLAKMSRAAGLSIGIGLLPKLVVLCL